jgi:capsular polysaccharide export protein
LTEDKLSVDRRTRKLSLDELVAGALILYPTYISRTTGQFTTPERALDELLVWREKSPVMPWWRKLKRGILKVEIMLNARFNNRL